MGLKVSRRGRVYWRDRRGRFTFKGTGTRWGSGRSKSNTASVARQRSRGAGVSRGAGRRIYRRPKYGARAEQFRAPRVKGKTPKRMKASDVMRARKKARQLRAR